MARELEEIPLFPLHTVIFPYAVLHLHIFEDRYLQMVRECIEFDRPFGIVLIRQGHEIGENPEPYLVGTAVRITQSTKLDSGQMDIQVMGERRFRIRKIEEESKPYMVGYIENLIETEDENSERIRALSHRARESFQQLIENYFRNQDYRVQVRLTDDPIALSFIIANYLRMENLEKQHLLEITTTSDRFKSLIPIIDEALVMDAPTLQQLTMDDLSSWVSRN
ncbi:MAG: LON peptidase substrate-binding domain-containing protein [Fimbriimonadaceae bacterium]